MDSDNSILKARVAEWPKISVVTPNFNQGAFLEQTILSVIDQNYPNLEYIIIDGGSTDGSVEIIKKYESHLSYWISESDNGLYEAINKGFKQATGTILMWINSDDMLHPGALFNVGEIFYKFPQVSWITGINTSFDEYGRVIGADRAKGFTKFDFYTYNYYWLQQESTVWRKSLWDEAGGALNTDLKLAGDLDLWIRFFRHAELYACDILIGGFRMRSKGQLTTTSIDVYHAEARQTIKAERGLVDKKTYRLIKVLDSIGVVKKILRYSIILDLKIFIRILNKISRDIRKKPHRIHVNRANNEFEITYGLNV